MNPDEDTLLDRILAGVDYVECGEVDEEPRPSPELVGGCHDSHSWRCKRSEDGTSWGEGKSNTDPGGSLPVALSLFLSGVGELFVSNVIRCGNKCLCSNKRLYSIKRRV